MGKTMGTKKTKRVMSGKKKTKGPSTGKPGGPRGWGVVFGGVVTPLWGGGTKVTSGKEKGQKSEGLNSENELRPLKEMTIGEIIEG